MGNENNSDNNSNTNNQDLDKGGEASGNENYLGDWKTKEEAERGLENLQSKLGSQGNELGTLRKNMELTQQVIDGLKGKGSSESQANAEVKPKIDYNKEIGLIDKKISELNPVDDNYHKDLVGLIKQSNKLVAAQQHEKTLDVATSAFKKELDSRDAKAAERSFYEMNPDFNTPEMQLRINDYIKRDKTGMSDPLVAFREIQRDDAIATAKKLTEENEALKKRLNLKDGTDNTGTVITDSSENRSGKKPAKVTGKDLDAGMRNVLNNLNNA